MFKIYPYKVGSASVRKLKEALDAVIIKTENSVYRFRNGHIVINWGNSRRPANLEGVEVINPPEQVAIAANKLLTLQVLEDEGVAHVPYTTSKEEAEGWAAKTFIRHSLTGHSGAGIEVVTPREVENFTDEQIADLEKLEEYLELAEEDGFEDLADVIETKISNIRPGTTVGIVSLPDAPLYTKAIANDGEYRVHVFNGDVILYQKKSRRVDEETGEVITAEGEDADVRNLASNWVYRTGNLRRLERIEQLAIAAVAALGLDFGAVDIIKDVNGDVFVLEINTAPGLGNTETLEVYTEAFKTLE